MSEVRIPDDLRRQLIKLVGEGFTESLQAALSSSADADCRYVVVRVDADDYAFLQARSHGIAHHIKFSEGLDIEPGVEPLLHWLAKAYHDECKGS